MSFAGFIEELHPRAHIMTVIPEGAAADEVAVDHAGFIDKRAATDFEIKLRLGHGGHAAAFHAIRGFPRRDTRWRWGRFAQKNNA